MTSVQQSALATYLREFHAHVGAAARDIPTANPTGAQRRLDFIEEEARELRDAVEAEDLVAIADALGDLAYVVYGTALHFGIDLDRVVAEVHRSNMTKSPAGEAKSIKGPAYEPPDLAWVSDQADDETGQAETVEILADPELVEEIGVALSEAQRSEVHAMHDVVDSMRKLGRLPE